jgi:hypothetical protein
MIDTTNKKTLRRSDQCFGAGSTTRFPEGTTFLGSLCFLRR